jgi:tRNA-Thr(GGU) m(6)t(6)A37 methyltransferase TsaA
VHALLSSEELALCPIGWVRSPLCEKVRAARQASVAQQIAGTIELLPQYQHALADLDTFERVWVLFWFDRARRPGSATPSKVLPPRSSKKRGVFATRSPHRPNPIGLSAVRLERIEGATLFVRDLDILDGTPVLDLKPYLPYADAFAEATSGWLDARDPQPSWQVSFGSSAEAQLTWLESRASLDLRARLIEALTLGPEPHAYRRIRKLSQDACQIAVRDWRATFRVADRTIAVERIATGYRPRELAHGADPVLVLHREFVQRFG